MKVRVKTFFVDRYNNTVKYSEGMVVDFADDRAKRLIARNLAEAVEVEQTQEKPPARKRKPKKL